jgi:WD40 repeat protein
MFGTVLAAAVLTSPPAWASSAAIAQTPGRVKPLRTLQGVRIVFAQGAPTGSLVALALENGSIRLVDASTGQTRRTLSGHPQTCYAVAFNSTGTRIATGDETGRIWVWETATGKKLVEFKREKGHKRGIQALSFSPDNRSILSVGKDDVIHLWSVSGGDPKGTILGSGANFYGASFLRNGNIVTATLKEGARIYRGSNLQLVGALTLPGGQGANDIAANSSGTFLATAGRDGRATFWNPVTRQRTGGVLAHADWVIYSVLSPNGRVLATSSNDRTIKLWDVKTGRLIAQVDDMSSVGSPIAFTGNGRFMVGADASDQAVLFAITPGV